MKSSVLFKLRNIRLVFITAILMAMLSSCYSVRIVSRDGVPQPDPLNLSADFYKGKQVVEIDTTITLKLQDGEYSLIEKCPGDGFFSVEFKSTLGGVLLNALTLGKKKRIKLKYVSLKQSD